MKKIFLTIAMAVISYCCFAQSTFPTDGSNVGIGTTTPGFSLDINKSTAAINLNGSGFGNSGARLNLLGWAGTNVNWQIGVANIGYDGLTFTPSTTAGGSTFTSPAMIINSVGNVGIGTTAPTANLDIRGALSGTPGDNLLRLGDPTFSFWSGLRLNATADLSVDYYTGGVWGTAMTVSHGNGNVGIGTINPGTRTLNVYTATNDVGIEGTNTTTNGANYGILGSAIGTGATLNTGMLASASGAAGNIGLRIYNVPAVSTNYALYIDAPAQSYFQGNVGIGTTSPAQTLTVVDAGNVNSYSGTFSVFANNLTQGVGIGYLGIQALGSNPNQDLSFNARGTGNISMQVAGTTGNVGIGCADTKGYKLAVAGTAIAESMTVKLQANWPDVVFKKNYALMPLSDVKTYIDKNQHLPEIPAAAEVEKGGLNLGEMNRLLVKKVEELTLYLIEKDKEVKEQKQVNELQEQRLKKLEEQMKLIVAK